MKAPYRWLTEHVDTRLKPLALGERLQATSSVLEGMEDWSLRLAGLVIGHVLDCTEHPNSDHLYVTQVAVGSQTRQIVCGASNVRSQINVIVALPGTKVGMMTISETSIRGVTSSGMLCSYEELGLPPDRVSIIPGNHDAYTSGAHRTRRFATTFSRYLQSDLPELTAPGEVFPYVHLRGPTAIIGLSTALPRLPLVASGTLGREQLAALARILEHPEVKARTVVILQHHPIHNPVSRAKTALEGLTDADEEAHVLRRLRRGLLLHGHLHRRIHRTLATEGGGHLDAVGATSASLLHASDERMAGFNVYDVGTDGRIESIESHRLEADGSTFRAVGLPKPS